MINLLTVCTGNICRSPYAERLLQAGLDSLHPGQFNVTSAGTMAMLGHEMDRRSSERLIAAGGDPTGHQPRVLHNVMDVPYDIVFAMAEEHRADAVKESPRMLKRAYSIMMFAELFDMLAADPASQLVRGGDPASVSKRWKGIGVLASRVRSRIPLEDVTKFDVPDPYKLEDDAYDRMESALKPAIYRILATEELVSAQDPGGH